MRLGTRLLITLLPTTIVVMTAYAGWALWQRENTLASAAQGEVLAYSEALGSAFDLALRDVRREDAQSLINQVSRAPTVYGILLYDSTGGRTIVSEPLGTPTSAPTEILQRVLATGSGTTLEREIDDQRVFSVLRALRGPSGRVTGVLEVAQPLSTEFEKEQIRRRFALNTITLLAALGGMTLWLVHRLVNRPMERLVTAVRAFGQGELAHRIPEAHQSGELATLAHEFNTMAANLERSQGEVAREADERVVLERRLRDVEKMAAIGNLAAGLAHEIAAPLNVISGRAEMMIRREGDEPTRHRNLTIIVRQISRITAIVRNLLDFAKRRELRLQPTDLGSAAHVALEFLDGELARAGVAYRIETGDPVVASVDPDLLHQVLVNLILNAVQAMEASDRPRRLVLRVRAAAPGAAIEVEDSGPGVPDDLAASIFEPFFTTKPGGTGLGLAVARRITEEHGGRLEVETSPDGTRFRVVLPLAQEPTRG